MATILQPDSQDLAFLKTMTAEAKKNLSMELMKKLKHLQPFMRNESAPPCVEYVVNTPDPTNDTLVITIFGILYLHIFVLGIMGNVAVMFLTFKHRHLQTVQNIFILNLALSDVIVCLLSLPFTPVTNIYKVWYFGSPFCHLLPMVQGISVFVSTFSLSAIALDRYNLVVRPHCHPLNTRRACLVAIVLWVISVIVCLPYGWYMKLQEISGYCGEYCSEYWPSQQVRSGYAIVVLAMQFILPFSTMAVCYYTIFSVLRERANTKLKKLSERTQLLENSTVITQMVKLTTKDRDPNPITVEDRQRLAVVAQQRRTSSILASMVFIFGITWLPHNVFTMLMDYDEMFFHVGSTDYTYLASMVAHCIAMLTNVANPFLYAWLNPSFKEMLIKTLRGRPRPDLKSSNDCSGDRKSTIIRVASTIKTDTEREF